MSREFRQADVWRGLRMLKGERSSRSAAPAILYFSANYGHAEKYALSGDPEEQQLIQAMPLAGLRIATARSIPEFRGRIGQAAYFAGEDAAWAASLLAAQGLDGVRYIEAGHTCYALRADAVYARIRTRTRAQWERYF